MDPHQRLTGDDPIIKGMRFRARALLFVWHAFLVASIAIAVWTLVLLVRDINAVTAEDLGAFFGRIAHGFNQAKGG